MNEFWLLLIQFVSMILSALAGFGVMSWYLTREDRKNGKR